MIRLESLTYHYPDTGRPALEEVTMQAEPGSLMLVAGRSGSGKSTLLRTTNGLVPHFYGGRLIGRVTVDGLDASLARPRDLTEKIGFVGQDPEDHGVMDSVEEDIAFALENLGVDAVSMRKRVEEVLDALGIAGLRSRRLDTLSAGQRQKVAIAGALVTMPSYLVLDEVTSQLDPQSAEEVIGAILRLRDEIGVSVVVAEHRLERLLQYAEQLCVIDAGRAGVGDPAAMLAGSPLGGPIVGLGKAMGWSPLPLSLRDAWRRLGARLPLPPAAPGAKPLSPGDVLLEARNLTVAFEGRAAVSDVAMTVAEGERVAVMGRNGSGKTTLLRALARLVPPGRGKVLQKRTTALVPQNPANMLFRSTLAAELAATLRGRGLPHDRAAVEREAAQFQVGDFLDRYPRDLSGGQKTRAAVAAAAAGGPRTVLLDEPTRGMDEDSKGHLAGLVRTWSDQGRAVVIATHDVELAAEIATRVVILSEGRIVVDGPPGETLASSLTFSTQMNKLFKDPAILTLGDALAALGAASR